MYLIDYHTHSELSPDSSALLLDDAKAAVAAGLSELCITDHFDLLTGHGKRRHASALNWAERVSQYTAVKAAMGDKLTFKLGMELGSGQVDADDAAQIFAHPELDFVIGSLHNSSTRHGCTDLYYFDYSSPAACYEILDDYFDCMDTLVTADSYDVLGHIIYPVRYMRERDGQDVDIYRCLDRIRAALKVVVARGKGIEVNTWCGRTVEEWRPLLALYRDLGGEYLTVGSDAHEAKNIGLGIRDAYGLLKDVGFRYVTTYAKHKPIQVKL